MDQTTITIGLGVVLVACFGGGCAVAIWFYGQMGSIKTDLLAAIAKSRTDGDTKTDEVSDKIDDLAMRQHAHELKVEERFVTKDSFNAAYARIEKGIEDVRADLRDLLRHVTRIGNTE